MNRSYNEIMGYDLQITRKEDYLDEEGEFITAQEWSAFVDDDPELSIQDSKNPYFADWSGPGDYPCWIDYDAKYGFLYSKNPTDEFLAKMIQIAEALGAKVQGQDGEVYLADGTVER